MEHGEREARAYNEGLGRSPSGVQGRDPNQAVRGRRPLKLIALKHICTPKERPKVKLCCQYAKTD